MTLPEHIFRAYDIRGVAGRELSGEVARQIGRALGSEARARGIGELVVGRDGRLSGAELVAALTAGILKAGVDVVDIGMVPTPVLYFAAARLGDGGGGAQVTGSHNPPDHNGVKMTLGADTLAGAAITDLARRIRERDFTTGNGSRREQDATTPYLRALTDDIRLAQPVDIVIDCGNGVAGALAPAAFRAIGCRVTELFCEVDGTFPNHHPDPSRPENLRDLANAVRRGGADFGIAFDGDGDRLGVVGGDGAIIWPDRQMLLFAAAVLRQQRGGEVIFDVKCSRLLPRAITAAGGVATMCKTGHSFIKNKLRESGAPLAGEMSGHIFFNERWGGFDDGLYAGARLCELLAEAAKAGTPPAATLAALPDSVNTPEINMPMDEAEARAVVAELTAHIRAADWRGAEVNTLDGVRVDFAAGFGLVRASNTTAALIMRFEADSDAELARIQARFAAALRALRPHHEWQFAAAAGRV